MMFWGLVLKANRKYSQTIKKPFHLSQAALDATSCNDEPVQVFLTSENNKYLICTLRKGKTEQVGLDLNFSQGDVISFQSQGNGSVHLSGYLTELEPDFSDEDDFDNEAAEINSKIKAQKIKLGKKGVEDDDDDESDDSDLVGGELEDDDDEDGGEEEDDDDDDDDDEDDEEAEEEESEEEIQEPKPKQAKLDKRKQQQQQNGVDKKTQKEGPKKEVKETPKGGEKTIQGGVKIEDIQVGNGAPAKAGKKVQVYYEGRLKSNNKIFDSSKQGAGFKFNLGRGEVIKAWDVGVAGMKVGGKRRIVCPPHMAYGARGSPPVIPPNSTLVFDVELKGVH